MKHYYLFHLLFLVIPSTFFGQMQRFNVNVKTNDLVYDAQSDRLYVSIPSSNGPNGNSIGVINPNTYALETTIFIGSEPSVLAIASDGSCLYSGFSGSSSVRKFLIPTLTADVQFPLGSDPFFGAYYAEDIEVMPDNPNSIAVSRMKPGFSPRHEGVAIYENGVPLSQTTQTHTGSNRIEFKDNNTIWGYNNETTEFGLRKVTVNANGLSEQSTYANLIQGFGVDFIFQDNKVYATNGQIIEVSNFPFVLGQFSDVLGPITCDPQANLVCFVSSNGWGSGAYTFKRYQANNFLLRDSYPINLNSNAESLVTISTGCYAFNTVDAVVILKIPTVSTDEDLPENTKYVYPNPTNSRLFWNSPADVEKVEIIDLHGSLYYQTNEASADVSGLTDGIYFYRLIDRNGQITSGKFVKTR